MHDWCNRRALYSDDDRRNYISQHTNRKQRAEDERDDHESSRMAASSRASSSGVADTVGTLAVAGWSFFAFQLRRSATTANAPAPKATNGARYPTRLNPSGRGAISARSPYTSTKESRISCAEYPPSTSDLMSACIAGETWQTKSVVRQV